MTLYELIHSINELPDNTWNKYLSGLLGPYDGAQDHNILSFVFYWREMFHFAGGVAIGILSSFLLVLPMPKFLALALPVLAVAIGFGLKEFLGDASEQVNGWDFKNVFDTAMWTLGTAMVSLLMYKGLF